MNFSLVAIGRDVKLFPYLFKMCTVLSALGTVEYVFWDRTPEVKNTTDLDNISYKPILKFEPKGRFGLLGGYFKWFFKVLAFMLFSSKKDTLYFASRLDSAAAMYLASKFRRSLKYIYLDRDAYFMTYNFGPFQNLVKWIELVVSRNAELHFIPGESRNFTRLGNVRVISNTPNKSFYQQAVFKSESLVKSNKFTIYVNGWLVDSRGAKMILDLARCLDPELFRIIVAGPSQCERIDQLVKEACVEYLGVLDNIDALSYYFISDTVLCFYDPSIEINRNAEPNKWFDCIFTNTVFITNFGIDTVAPFSALGLCKLVEYNNSENLIRLVKEMQNNFQTLSPTDYQVCREKLGVDFWDSKVKSIIEKYINSGCDSHY